LQGGDGVHPGALGHAFMADIYHEAITNFYRPVGTPASKRLWYGTEAVSLGNTDKDHPYYTIYLPENQVAPTKGILVIPGGGYSSLADDHEGKKIGAWCKERNIAAFVLRYRVSPYRHPIPLTDAKRAMRLIRYHAAEYNLDTNHIGVIGFSAGGHLASSLGTLFDEGVADSSDLRERKKSRPDFMILGYPVIDMIGTEIHAGSRDNLLGNDASDSLKLAMSTYTRVTEYTPPTFIFSGDADNVVPIHNSILMDSALQANNIPSVLHVDSENGHGYGLGGNWSPKLEKWIANDYSIPVSIQSIPSFSTNKPEKLQVQFINGMPRLTVGGKLINGKIIK
jgi:acetyl esterase/lipase